MTGYTWEEMEVWRVEQTAQLIHPDDLPFVMDQGRKKAAGNRDGVVAHYSYRGINKEGKVRWIDQYSKTVTYGGKSANLMTFIDIHDQKMAQETLMQSEKRYRDLADSLPQVVYESDENGNLMFVNRNGLDVFGYSQDDFDKGINCIEMLIPEDRNRAAEDIQRLKNGKGSGSKEYTALKKDGSTIPVSIHSNPLFHDNKFVGFRGILIDLTQARKAESALRESEAKYRLIAENTADLILVLDMDLRFTYVSPAVMRLRGYTVEEAMEQTLAQILTPESMQLWLSVFEKEMQMEAGGTAYPNRTHILELEVYKKDGSAIWMEVSLSYLRDEDRKPVGILMVSRDITDRKRADEARRESESNLQSVFEAVPVGICFMRDRVYQRANQNWCDSFGYPEETLIGKTPEFLYESREEYERVGKELYGYLLKDGIASVHTRLKRSDGEFREVVLISKPLNSQDLEAGTVVVVHDVTDRKRAKEEKGRLEEQFQRAQKMEAIGTLAGGIAHDFNNILMAIQGRTSMMLMNKDFSHPDFGHLRGIEGYVGNAADLTKQLLGFARGGKYEVRPTDLNELIRKENRMFGRTKKEITIHEKYVKNLWPVEVDRGQIQQVLLNLYVNAWQAMPGGGNIYLETENVTLDDNYVKPFSVEPGRYVKISIADTGIGMDKAIQERIFDPFFTTKEMGLGTGLGLASAYGIIKNHGGFIDVYSEKDHGATFRIYLRASEKEVMEEKKPAGDTLKGFETVLFVDDESMVTEVSEGLLELLGYKVFIAKSGKEAIKIYKEKKDRIDIVMLDMIMPEMSGGETYDRMKDINPKVKVLLSSGYSINGQATGILDRGCNGFIQKPFKIKKLSQKLREILDER